MADIKYNMERIDAMEGHEFEHFIAALLRNLGYESVEVTPGSGDQGVDVLAEKDSVRYAIQCKCYSSDLGNGPVQEVNTGKVIYQCHVGVVVTNRYFTQGAKDAAKATGILLWDRDRLQKMIAQAQGISIIELPVQQKNDAFMLWSGNPLLKRGEIALRDKEWKKASQFFNRVLNTDPKNAEAYLGLALAEAEVPDANYLSIYLSRLNQLSQNNLRHAKEFAGGGLRAWFIEQEAQQKDAEVRQTKKTQKQKEMYKQVILDYLSENYERVFSPYDIWTKVLFPVFPGELWSDGKAERLLIDLSDKEGKIVRIKCNNGKNAFKMTEAERRRLLEQTAEGRHRLKREQTEKRATLESEQAALQMELANLKGLFTGKRQKKIKAKLNEIASILRKI